MMNKNVSIFLLLISSLTGWCYNYDEKPKPKPNSTDWDVLVFTQRWPVTICSQWLKTNVSNSCALPSDSNIWTVHGLWPTKSGTRGPWNCNKNDFNQSAISNIESELKERWINIENNTKLTSFWSHEWEKHGTCAQLLQALNSELKYFSKGLEWNKIYNIHEILVNGAIVPSVSGYTIERIDNSLKNVLKHNPIIQCVVDKNSKQSLLSEVQICFDRTFNIIDCDPVKGLFYNVIKIGNVLTDCSLKKIVVYPSHLTELPVILEPDVHSTMDVLLEDRSYWIGIYKTIKYLIWATV